MKLKFRADKKDVIIFLIFCVFLLYLVAIGVLNILQFLEDGTLSGFNPFPAFTGDILWPTLILYTLALILVMSSVSSYFFDREKGIGFVEGKKDEKGYSRWAKDREMKKVLSRITPSQENAEVAGIPLINNGKEIWVDNGEFHNLIIGSTGSGKTQIIVFPMVKSLAKKGESMIITDPKGEIYERTGALLKEKGYNIVLLNFRDPQKGNAWNPFSLPYSLYKEGNTDKATELVDDLAANILHQEKGSDDPFWENSAGDYFTGLTLALFEDAKSEEEINLNSINLMSNVGEEKFAGSNYMKEYFSTKNPAGSAYINVSGTINTAKDTQAGILSFFRQGIKLFSSRENLSEMLAHNDFDMKDIGRKKTAVFIIIQDEKKTYHSLATIFIKQVYETLIDVAQESGGKLPYRTNFILDEFANMPPLKDVTTMVTAARSRSIRFSFIIQNFAQLYQVYGKENGETIKGNCGNIVYLISSELSALEEISKMCGEVKSKEKEKTASTPLVTVSDLQRLKEGEIIVLRTRMMPFHTKMTYDWQMNWGKSYDLMTYPTRQKVPVSLFDLKSFVSEQHKKKMDDMFGNMTSGIMGSSTGKSDSPIPPFAMPDNKHDVNEMIKRIDEEIARLQKEEQQETNKNENSISEKPSAKDSNSISEPSSIAIPEIQIQDVVEEETPKAKVPSNSSITIETPKVEVPEEPLSVEIPKVEVPSNSSITIETPKVEVPEGSLSVEIPKVEVPSNSSITIETPKVEIPEGPLSVEIPKVESVVSTEVKSKSIVPIGKYDQVLEEEISAPNLDYVTDDEFFDDFFSDEN